MQELEDGNGSYEEAEIQEDLARYARLIAASDATWLDFWLLGTLCMVGGVAVFALSSESWALAGSIIVFLILFVRTARIIGRLDGELSFLHRKWVRRGHFFVTDGHTAEALPHDPQ